MALDQSLGWLYQSDPTKAIQNGQWIDASEYVNPWGAKNPKKDWDNNDVGYMANIGGKPKYTTYASLGMSPLSVAGGNISSEAGDFTTPTSYRPPPGAPEVYNPDEGFFEGMLDSVKSTLSEKGLMTVLTAALAGGAAGGAFGGVAGGAGAAGEMAGLGGWAGMGPIAPGAGTIAGAAGSGGGAGFDMTGGGMPEFDLFDPSTWGAGSGGDTGWGGFDAPTDFTQYGTVPEGWENWTLPDVNGSGLVGSSSDLLQTLAQKFGPQVAKTLLQGAGTPAGKGLLAQILSSLGIDPNSILGGIGGLVGDGISLAARSAPGLMALDYAKSNSGGSDTSGLEGILARITGNQDSIVKAATDPLQANIAAGYGDLVQSQGVRGIRGSSFGDTDIANYISRTGTALAGAGANAASGSLAMQGTLAAQIAKLKADAQTAKNNLFGKAFDVLGRGINPGGFGSALTLAGP